MGDGRRGNQYRRRNTGSSGGGSDGGGVQTRLANKSPEIAGEVIIEVLAATNPTVAALYLAYKVAKFVYPIVKKGADELERSGDKDKAVEKMKEETVRQTGKEIVKASIGAVVSASYSTAVDSSGIKTNKTIDTLVVAATSKVIEEVVVGD